MTLSVVFVRNFTFASFKRVCSITTMGCALSKILRQTDIDCWSMITRVYFSMAYFHFFIIERQISGQQVSHNIPKRGQQMLHNSFGETRSTFFDSEQRYWPKCWCTRIHWPLFVHKVFWPGFCCEKIFVGDQQNPFSSFLSATHSQGNILLHLVSPLTLTSKNILFKV